jgi:hypothetical protein
VKKGRMYSSAVLPVVERRADGRRVHQEGGKAEKEEEMHRIDSSYNHQCTRNTIF